MDEMTAYDIDDYVSQAESGGVTLAQVLASNLSADELDRMQGDLMRRMADNYRSIEGYMSDVEVPSMVELSNLSDAELQEFEVEIAAALSDTEALAHC